MKWLLALMPGGFVILALLYLRRQWSRADDAPLSARWLEAQARRDARAGCDGVCIDWPIDKLRNESGWVNRYDEHRRRGAA